MTGARIQHPLSVGTRVHHRGGIYSASWFGPHDFVEHENGGPYWGTIVEIHERGRFADGSYEYLVQRDAAHGPDMDNRPTWWASYHVDRVAEATR